MKIPSLLLPAAAFAATALAAGFWPGLSGGPPQAGGENVSNREGLSSRSTDPAGSTGPGKPEASTAIPGTGGLDAKSAPPLPENGSAVAAAAPSMDEVFQAGGLDRMLLMARFIQTATSAELAEVIGRAARENNFEPTFTDQAWLRWVEVDRTAALDSPHAGSAWWALAKLDPEGALDGAMKTNPDMVGSVLHSIAQSDPALARKILAEHPDLDGQQAVNGLIEGMEKFDPAAATALALEKSPYRLEETFKGWFLRDPAQAMAWMRGIKNPVQLRKVEDVAFKQLIATNPAEGLKESALLPPGKRQVERSIEAIAALGRADPAAARAAADALPTPRGRQQALARLAGSLASSDPAAAAAMIPSLDWKFLSNMRGGEWSYEPPPKQPNQAEGGTMTADIDPEGRIQFTGMGNRSGSTYNNVPDEVLTKLMTASPQATIDALAALPESSGAPLSSAVQKWAGLQPEAASTWLKDQPPGPARDEGIQGLTQYLINGQEPDFTAALAWAEAASPELRNQLYMNTLTQWKSKDPAAAQAAAATLPVTEEQRGTIQQVFQ